MPAIKSRNPADYIVPLNINGLDGRMLKMPPPKTKRTKQSEVLFVYGLHSSLERWWGLIQVLNRYAAVTVPDMPGFGGMDSFYSIGKKPSLDNMADYLAAFIKLRYRRKKIAIVGMSYGFIVVTRTLQRYPELTKKVVLLVSLAGFAHRDDFIFSKPRYYSYLYGTRFLSHNLSAKLFRHTALNPSMLRAFYGRTHNAKKKFALAMDAEEVERIKDVEVWLWRNNDLRTWAYATAEFLVLDNCKVKVNLPVWHVATKNDTYFDNHIVEQHLRVIYSGFDSAEFVMASHAPSILATEKDAAALVPTRLRRVLSRIP